MHRQETAHYTVKAGTFEGPMDVLLRLIEEHKLFINEISLAAIADDYIAYVRGLSNFHAGDVTSFVLVAATLVLIKSKSLLPNLALTEEESGEIVDLERRLKLYQIIKDAGVPLREQFGRAIIFARSETFDIGPVFSPDAAMTKEALRAIAESIIDSIPKKEFLPEVSIKKVISIEEMIASLADRIQEGLRMSFSDFSGRKNGTPPTKEEKVYVIVSFLAMLELVREGLINAMQENRFEDITLEKQEHDSADNSHKDESINHDTV